VVVLGFVSAVSRGFVNPVRLNYFTRFSFATRSRLRFRYSSSRLPAFSRPAMAAFCPGYRRASSCAPRYGADRGTATPARLGMVKHETELAALVAAVVQDYVDAMRVAALEFFDPYEGRH